MSTLFPEWSLDAHGQRTLRHVPALDGVRAVGVLLVFLFHLQVLGFGAGFVGVDVFFVLSGFLITSLLLAEFGATGRIKLSVFWARRARRLLPALALVLVVVALVTMKTATFSERGTMRGDLVSTTLYVGNWHFISSSSYFSDTGVVSPLRHTWSLGIEEQFYLLWPLLVFGIMTLLARVRRGITVAALVGTVASAILVAVLYSPGATDRAYMGTDARMFEPLLGAAVAALVARRRWWEFLKRRGDGLMRLGALLLVAMLATIRPGGAFYYRGGAILVSLAACLLVAPLWVGRGGAVKRFLEWRPMVWIGLISYGLYLWHWPFVVWLHIGQVGGVDGEIRKLIAVAATFAAATASYYLIERPIRTAHGWHLPWAKLRLRLGFLRRPLIVLSAVPLVMILVVGVSVASTRVPPPAPGQPVVMLTGDSVPARLEPYFEQVVEPRGWRVVSVARGSCPVSGEETFGSASARGEPDLGKECPAVPPLQNEMIRADHPDVIVWWDRWSLSAFIGPNGVGIPSGTPRFWRLRQEGLDQTVRRLTAGGARVLFIATEPPGMSATENCAGGCKDWRGFEISHYGDVTYRWNQMLASYAAAHPNLATFMSVTSVVCQADVAPCRDRVPNARPGGVHYMGRGAFVVTRYIVKELAKLIAARPS